MIRARRSMMKEPEICNENAKAVVIIHILFRVRLLCACDYYIECAQYK